MLYVGGLAGRNEGAGLFMVGKMGHALQWGSSSVAVYLVSGVVRGEW